jgi:hypothetical protein
VADVAARWSRSCGRQWLRFLRSRYRDTLWPTHSRGATMNVHLACPVVLYVCIVVCTCACE